MVDSIQDKFYMAATGNASAYNYLTESFNPYNNSVFGTTMMPYSYCGFGYGDPSQYAQYNNQMAESNLQIFQKNAATNSLINAPEQAVERQMGNLQRQILKDNQDNIEEEYTKLYEEVRKMYSDAGYENVSDSQVKAYIENTYAQKTGSRLVEDIENHSSNPFVHGLVQGTGFGYLFGDKKSAGENVSMITGEKEATSEKAATWAGRILGAAATILAAPFAVKFGGKAVKVVAKGYKALL